MGFISLLQDELLAALHVYFDVGWEDRVSILQKGHPITLIGKIASIVHS